MSPFTFLGTMRCTSEKKRVIPFKIEGLITTF